MISVTSSGSFKKTATRLQRMQKINILAILATYGQAGVDALARATPLETGLTAASWDYKVSAKNGVYKISWTNSDVENGFPVAIMLQYGYGTGTGGYVQGQDYINPAIKPIFDQIALKVQKAVTSA
jgi:hypothetical protein